MRFVQVSLLALLFIPAFASGSGESSLPAWEKTDEKDGITIYRREIPGSPIIAFRGTGVVDAPISKVAGIVFDPSRAPEWAQDIEESRVVRWISQPLDFIEYSHIGTPIVIKDREFVSRVSVTIDETERSVSVRFKAAEPSELPPTKYIRGDLTGSGFVMKSIDDGKRTFVDGSVHADPKGAIPKWLVNLTQKSWPYKTLQAIRKQAKKTDIVPHPHYVAIFEKSTTRASAP